MFFALSAPGLLISVGILGTFFGILVGLMGFDVTSIEASIPRLLDGMKTAFVTSVAGAGGAIFLKALVQPAAKYIEHRRERRPRGPAPDEVTAGDIHAVLSDIRDRSQAAEAAWSERLDKLREAVGGDGDATLVSQTRLTRQAITDGFAAQSAEMRSFTEKVSKLGSEAMIDALRQVISDFNTKLTEQFGDNFKHLNAAVEKLVIWQEEYRQSVEVMGEQLRLARSAVEESQHRLTDIADQCGRIPPMLDKYDTLIRGLTAQHDNLNAGLEAFADLRDRALGAFPIIESNLNDLTAGFAAATTTAVSNAESMLDEHKRAFERLHGGFEELRNETTKVLTVFQTAHGELLTRTAQAGDQQRRQLDAVAEQVAQHWKETADRHRVDLAGHLEALRHINSEAAAEQSRLTTAAVASAGLLLEQQEHSFQRLHGGFEELRNETTKVLTVFQTAHGELLTRTAQAGDQQRRQVDAVAEQVAQHWKETADRHRVDLAGHLEALRKSNAEALAEQNRLMNNRIEELDRALEAELKKSMESLGGKMLGLHQHIVNAYDPFIKGIRRYMEAPGTEPMRGGPVRGDGYAD